MPADDTASIFYPNEAARGQQPAPTTALAASQPPSSEKSDAECLYPDTTPEKPLAYSDGTSPTEAEALYGIDGGALQGLDCSPFHDAMEVPPEIRAEEIAATQQTFADLGASKQEADSMLHLLTGTIRERPTAQVVQHWERQTWEHLKYSGAEKDLDLARRFIAKHPKVAKVLDATGLGSHPEVVKLAISKARAAQRRGRL